uniref:Uncharacterized protein n=1 Tax=Arundo donax TaxID=35708 RepID=A0A0A9AT02_ARUDO
MSQSISNRQLILCYLN